MRKILLTLVGVVISTLPVMLCTLSYLPIWQERGAGATLSGFTFLVVVACFMPLFKLLKRLLASPAAHTMWFLFFVLFFALSKIADEMTVISFVGFVSNLIGAAIFKMARIGTEQK